MRPFFVSYLTNLIEKRIERLSTMKTRLMGHLARFNRLRM